jgi:phosphatidylinositol-3-phosphatase
MEKITQHLRLTILLLLLTFSAFAENEPASTNVISPVPESARPASCPYPFNIQITNITTTDALVQWTAVTGSVDYIVRYRNVNSNTWIRITVNTNSCQLTGLSAGNTYEVKLRTECTNGQSAYTNPVTFITTASVCGIPAGLNATNISTTSASLNWTALSCAVRYDIQYRVTGTSTWTAATSTTASLTVSSLTPSTQYEFQTSSVDAQNIISAFSAPSIFTTTAVPTCAMTTGLSANSITSSGAVLSWTPVSGAAGYNVRYSFTGTSAWTNVSTASASYAVSGLNSSTQYEFQVQTNCGSLTSSFTTSTSFTTGVSAPVCSAAGNLSASSVSTSGAVLNWSSVSGAAGYNVRYRITSTSTWTSTGAISNSITLTGLASGTQYEFQIQTDCGSIQSSFTSSATFTTTSSVSCGIPSALTTLSVSSTSASLDWSSVSGADDYNLRYKVVGSSAWITIMVPSSSHNLSGLTAGTQYEFQAQAICGTTTGSFSSSAIFNTSSVTSTLPVPDHIVVCIMENKSYSQVMGSSAAPYINALAADSNSALFTQSFGITHPSQPNYLHLFSGANQGVTNNVTASSHFNTPNLARALINAGKTFITYSEGLPSVGYDGDASGKYVRKHNPVANWMGTGTNQVSPTLNQPFTSFPSSNFASLPTVSFVVPNLDNDMHDGSITTGVSTGDSWFNANMAAYVTWAKTHNSLLILTFDEDDGSANNSIVTVFSGEMVTSGTYATTINHHNILRTIEEMYGLPFAGNSANVPSIHGCWTNGFRVAFEETTTVNGLQIFPNPFDNELKVQFEAEANDHVLISISDITGRAILSHREEFSEQGLKTISLNTDAQNFPAGIYIVTVQTENHLSTMKIVREEK